MSRIIFSRQKTVSDVKIEDAAIAIKNRAESLLLALTNEHSLEKSADEALLLKKELDGYVASILKKREEEHQAALSITQRIRVGLEQA